MKNGRIKIALTLTICLLVYFSANLDIKKEKREEVWKTPTISSENKETTDRTTGTGEQSDFSSFEKNTEKKIEESVRETYPFVSVVDGDTIKILVNNEKTSVRLIGVDTPEKYSTRYGYAECFGEEASAYLNNLMKWVETVEIEFDDTQGTYDKYGRILGYLFVNGENYNQKMIADGYAREYTYNTPYKYQKEFKQAQKDAQLANYGLRSPKTCQGERKSV